MVFESCATCRAPGLANLQALNTLAKICVEVFNDDAEVRAGMVESARRMRKSDEQWAGKTYADEHDQTDRRIRDAVIAGGRALSWQVLPEIEADVNTIICSRSANGCPRFEAARKMIGEEILGNQSAEDF